MKELRHHGIHVQIRDDGDFFINATAAGVTLGEAEAWAFIRQLWSLFDSRARDGVVDHVDQANADAANNRAYENGIAPVIETNVAGDPTVSQVHEVGEGSVAVAQPTVQNADIEIPTEVGAPIRKRGPGRPRKVQPNS